jgi:hypothetical protein
LAVGFGVGAAVASTPGIATADALDFQISIDGYELLPMADNGATATSSFGDIAIAFGHGATAFAVDGNGDFAEAIGTGANADSSFGSGNIAEAIGINAGAFAGQNHTSDFDTAIDIGDNSTGGGAFAEFGSGNLAFVDAANSHAYSGGDSADPSVTGNNDVAVILDPFGSGGDTVYSGGPLGEPGSYDFGATLFDDNTYNYLATGANYLYDILSPFGNESGTAAATSGGWLADLLALF